MTISTSDIRWRAETNGDKGFPPLVMLHGFAQSLNSFTLHLDELAKRFRLLRLDLPGHGGTAAPLSLDWPTLCANLHEAVTQLDKRHAHWFGYSQGGRVALMVALSFPDSVKSLSLLGASSGIPDPVQRDMRMQSDRLLGQNIVGRGMEWFADHWESLPIFATQKFAPESTRKLIRAERMSCPPQGLRFALDSYGTGTMPDCFEKLTQWTKPLFLMAGEADTKFAESNARIAGASRSRLLHHHVFPNCGHAAHLEQPSQFTRFLTQFIQAAESKSV